MNLNHIVYGNLKLSNILFAVLVMVLGLILAKIISNYLRRSLKTKMNKDRLELIIKIVYYLLVLVTVIWVLSALGIKLSGLMVAGGFLGIIIGFASQSIVGNLVSGIFLTIERPMKIGNAVNIDGTVGIVEDINIISTRLRTFDGLDIRIPNEKVFTTSITNYVSNIARRFEYSIGIRYEDDAQKAIDIIIKFLNTESFVLVNPAPLVFVAKLDDSSVNIAVKIWSPVSQWYSLYMRLLWDIKVILEENDICVAFPQQVIHFADKENAPTIKPGQ
ncbi:MAG: mechanosensitive ion channel family protein [Candidatus Cloacimonetes bacterium]|nr:mechanosensitive ion channel family protein [Candidatus Cloacimonadota bacterium]